VLKSAAYRDLSLWARAILVELVGGMNGWNNGHIVMSQRMIAAALGTSNFRAIGRAIAELMEHGLIDVTIEGQWKARKAREYRLTFVSTKGANATNDYRLWEPTRKSGADGASARQPKSADTASASAHKFDDGASARISANRRKTADLAN
jgi:hypothetical protein